MIVVNVPIHVSESGSKLRTFMREHVPGLEQLDNLAAQQITDTNRPCFPVPGEMTAWSDAIADATYLRLAWSLTEPSETAHELFLHAVSRGVRPFHAPRQRRSDKDYSRALCRDFIGQISEVPLFSALADRNRDIQGSLRDEYLLNSQLLCAAALANCASTSGKSTRQHKRPLSVSAEGPATLHEFVPENVVRMLGNYLMLAEDEIAYREISPKGGHIFAELRDATTAAGTHVAYYDSTFPIQRPWLVANRTLLDITATRRTKPSLHKSLRTLTGLILADVTDEFGIQSVAWYHAQSGQLYERSAAAFLSDLGATKEIPKLRELFSAAYWR